jgi:hypothetical protein
MPTREVCKRNFPICSKSPSIPVQRSAVLQSSTHRLHMSFHLWFWSAIIHQKGRYCPTKPPTSINLYIYIRGSVHRESLSINCKRRCEFVQFLFPANCSTCFGRYLNPSSVARVRCNYSIWHRSNRMLPSAVVVESELIQQQQRKISYVSVSARTDATLTAEGSIRFGQRQNWCNIDSGR